jgi:hypothetical protein
MTNGGSEQSFRPSYSGSGGAGFIGSHVADRLARIDTVLDNPGFGRADLISRHPDDGKRI